MSLRPAQSLALRRIERDLTDWYPCLDALFFSFTERARGARMPRTERIRAKPLRLLARLRRRPDRDQATKTGVAGTR